MNEDEKKLVKDKFKEDIGNTIHKFRTKKNISQENLADFLSLDRASISRYEKGKLDISAALLPLISIYCDFPMKEYINTPYDKEICSGFRTVVQEIVRQHKNIEKRRGSRSKKELVAKVYNVDGKEQIEEVPKKKSESFNQKVLTAKVTFKESPLTDEEFAAFVKENIADIYAIIDTSSGLLRCIERMDKKDTLKIMISELAIREIVVERLSNVDDFSKRLYMYYKTLYDKECRDNG